MTSVQPKSCIAVVTDDPGWHGRELRSALAAHAYGCRFVSLADCRLQPGNQSLDVVMPGFTRRLPEAVMVRGVAGGSLEQVILRLNVLHALEGLGIPVMNPPRAIEHTVDKGMTSLLLARDGIPGPPTWVCEAPEQARAILRRETAAGHRLVGKPLFGSQGQGLCLLDAHSSLDGLSGLYGGVYYLQRYVDRGDNDWADIRVFVVGDRALAAMTRHGSHWITNRAQGARCEPLHLDAELERMACAAARAVGVDYAGVDLMRDRDGRLQVIEVNGIPAWWGLQQATGVVVAEHLVTALLARLPRPDLALVSP